MGRPGKRQWQTEYLRTSQHNSRSVGRAASSFSRKRPDSNLRPHYDRSSLKAGGGGRSKNVPKNIMQDKEQLYEEALQLKQSMNEVRKENVWLKTQMHKCENEVSAKDKKIQELLEQLRTPQAGFFGSSPTLQRTKGDLHLMLVMKRKMKEVAKENKALKDDIQLLKRDIKLTSFHEKEVEAQLYAEECIRLRKLLDERTARQSLLTPDDAAELEQKVQTQSTLMATLKRENLDLTSALQKQEAELKSCKANLTSGLQHASDKSQALVKEQQKEIQMLKDQIEQLKKSQDNARGQKNQQSIEKLQREKAALVQSAAEKEETVRTLQLKVAELQRAQTEKRKETVKGTKNSER